MNFAKIFLSLGLLFVLVGLVFYLGSKIGISFGKLPGDVFIQKEKHSVCFPIVSSILISILLTLILNLFLWLFRK